MPGRSSLNGELTHGQRVELLTACLRMWQHASPAMHAYDYLAACGSFDAETCERIQWLLKHQDVPLNKLPPSVAPLAHALKAAFRNLCAC